MENLAEMYKLKLKDVEPEVANKLFDTVQLKYDGFWTVVIIKDGIAQVFSSSGELRETFSIATGLGEVRLICEWMYGTTWGIDYSSKSGYRFIVHDIVMFNGVDVREYGTRRRFVFIEQALEAMVNQTIFKRVESWSMHDFELVWNRYIPAFEGVVFKNAASIYGDLVGRHKRVVTQDYVFMGVNGGAGKYEGTTGSVIGGLYINGVLTAVCSVGGLSDNMRAWFWENKEKLAGKVFEAHGKVLFESGALRHPGFARMRPDKKAEECIL